MGNRFWKGKAPAKINLSLDVRDRLPNGYHRLSMLMQTIDLADVVELTLADPADKTLTDTAARTRADPADLIRADTVVQSPAAARAAQAEPEISLTCVGGDAELPCDSRNLAWKAAAAFFARIPGPGVHIRLTKHIPAAAGLAGGSADAAAVLRGLNHLYKHPLTREELAKIGVALGADIPFCLYGGTCLAEGIGEVLTPLPSFAGHWLVLVKPPVSVSTAWVFAQLDLNNLGERPKTDLLLQAIQRGEVRQLATGMRNVLERITEPVHPEIARIREQMLSLGAMGSRMSGSGPSVFGLFASEAAARRAQAELAGQWTFCRVVKTIDGPRG